MGLKKVFPRKKKRPQEKGKKSIPPAAPRKSDTAQQKNPRNRDCQTSKIKRRNSRIFQNREEGNLTGRNLASAGRSGKRNQENASFAKRRVLMGRKKKKKGVPGGFATLKVAQREVGAPGKTAKGGGPSYPEERSEKSFPKIRGPQENPRNLVFSNQGDAAIGSGGEKERKAQRDAHAEPQLKKGNHARGQKKRGKVFPLKKKKKKI